MTDSANTYAEVDVTALPFVIVRVVGPITEESFVAYLEELLAAIQLQDRVVLRMHAGPLTAFPSRYVRMSVAWMKENQGIVGRHVVGLSLILNSSVLRMAVQAMVWASRPSFPITAVDTTAEADAWLLARLDEERG